MNQLTKSRMTLVGLILIFFLPIFASWYLVFFSDYKNEINSIENGDLIEPVISLGAIEARPVENNQPFIVAERWTLVFFVNDECDAVCQKKLYQVRQIRLALGKNVDKIDRLLIAKNPIDWAEFAERYSGQKVLDSTMNDFTRIYDSFSSIQGFNENSFYLIDPYGFIMMRYSESVEPKGVIKDIERLIKNAG